MNQRQILAEYAETYEKFNPVLFEFDDNSIIEDLKKVILSCQRDKSFTIKVEGFEIVESYSEIRRILHDYEQSLIKNNSKTKKDNPYDYINLKDSDVKLLIVHYYIAINDKQDRITVYITVPRIVEKFYFRISGNLYFAMHQIVDASTYNNSNSNSKVQSVTLKTMFMPIRIYKIYEKMKTTKKEELKASQFQVNMFTKTIACLKYFFAHFGWFNTFKFFGMDNLFLLTDYDPEDEQMYTFMKNDIYLSIPKFIFNKEPIAQSFCYTIMKSINKNTRYKNMFTNEYWIKALGEEFSNNAYTKGLNILDSLESIYDQITKESIHLPEELKSDIYLILKWMISEFNALRTKDNLDISTKKIRKSEYIASLYAMKLARGIYRVSDQGKKATIESIKRAIVTKPNYLLAKLTSKCSLINYCNSVNDLDAFTALKFSYKGIAGIGEKKNSSVPKSYRYIYPEHLGRIDLDQSSATDPGISGTLAPLLQIYDGSFSEFEEPYGWDEEFALVVSEYKRMKGLKECIVARKGLLDLPTDTEHEDMIDETLSTMGELIKPIVKVDCEAIPNSFDLTADGNITTELNEIVSPIQGVDPQEYLLYDESEKRLLEDISQMSTAEERLYAYITAHPDQEIPSETLSRIAGIQDWTRVLRKIRADNDMSIEPVASSEDNNGARAYVYYEHGLNI